MLGGKKGPPVGPLGDTRADDAINYKAERFKNNQGIENSCREIQRCMEKLNTLAISVMNQWPGVKLRVTEAWDEGNYRSRDSLHYEGRAVDITTSDRDRSKYGMLARLAVEAGFDWVYYESRAHIHCSVKSESSQAVKSGGCFTGNSTVVLENGARRPLNELELGEKVMTYDPETGKVAYSEVIMFLDRDPSEKTKFVSLLLSSGKELRVTPQHLVMRKTKSGSEAVFAARLEPGDLLYTKTETGRVTTSVLLDSSFVVDEGVIAPLTRTGTIIVNDVVASCYAVIESQTVAHASFIPYRLYTDVANSIYSSKKSSHNFPTGVPWYPKILYFLSRHLLPDSLIYK